MRGPSPRRLAGLTFAAAALALAVQTRGAAQLDGDGFDDCPGGPIQVSVSVDESVVLVGNEAAFTAEITTGTACWGAWGDACPGPPPAIALSNPPEDLTKVVCCKKVGPLDWIYEASSGGLNGKKDQGRATVTVVGPDRHTTGRYGEASQPYPVYPNTQVANLITYLHNSSAVVGPCAEVTKVEAKTFVWDMQEGYYVQTADWAEVGWLSWVVKDGKAFIDHHFGAHCADIDAVAVGEPCGPALRFEYRVTFAGGCGADDFKYVTAPGVVAQPYRTGPCQYELRMARSDF